MSLLMDALKKAEQAKRQGQTGEAAGGVPAQDKAAALALEPLEPTTEAPVEKSSALAPNSLPQLPSQLEVLDAEFMEHIQRSAPAKKAVAVNPGAPRTPPAAEKRVTPDNGAAAQTRQPASPPDAAREAVKNVFDAKQAPAGKSKVFAISVGIITLVSAIGIGVYLWMQLRPTGGLAPVAQMQPRPIPPVPAPAVPQVPPPAVQPPAPVSAPHTAAAEAMPSKPPAEAVTTAPAVTRATTPRTEAPIRITTSRLKVNPALVQAFDELNAGDLAAARADYAQVLKSEPKSPDALHGMAAVALRQGQLEAAEEFYLRAIEADPKDAIAQAGLFGLRRQGDPVNSESRLKNLIAAQPDQPFLHFALGNVYAAAGRWNEAQQAFFKAYTGDPEHPDYLFNLAISLDHLRQSKLAAQYYNQALAATGNRPASFDKAQAATRLRELQP